MSRRHPLQLAAGLMVCLLGFTACSRPSDEAAIHKAIDEIAAALEQKNARAVSDHLASEFADKDGRDKLTLRRFMALQFLRNPHIHVLLHRRSVTVLGQRAEVTLHASLAGRKDLLPQRVQSYFITMEWHKQGGAWLLWRLDWEPLLQG